MSGSAIALRQNAPLVTGISPHQGNFLLVFLYYNVVKGAPGTSVTIRGERLGEDSNDLVDLGCS